MIADIKKFTATFNKIAHSKSEENVFTDYLDMVICALSAGKYEEEYLSIVKRYKKEEVNLFCELMAEMLIVMDNHGAGLVDCLGEFYQQYIGNSRLQQFFTPQHICDFMAQIIMGEDTTAGKIIADPCCGSGRMLLSAAKVNRNNIFSSSDIDIRCVKMCTINLCLNRLQGEVHHMNSLSGERWGGFAIEIIHHGHIRVPVITKLKADEGKLIPESQLSCMKREEQQPDVPQPKVITITQTKLDI
jgi:type I restriction-modification system DNA methylase subunit